jgi:hypothetical protein
MLSDKIFIQLLKLFGKLREKLKRFPFMFHSIKLMFKLAMGIVVTFQLAFGRHKGMQEDVQTLHIALKC